MKRRVSAVLVASLALIASGCVSAAVRPLPGIPAVKQAPTSTSLPDFSASSLPSVAGTTTTLAPELRNGNSSILGRVLVGGGPVGGAVVRIDRFVGDKSVGTTVTSNPDGTYGIDNVQGGRYRLRAFRAPDATQLEPQIVFVAAGERHNVDLELDKFGGSTKVAAAIAPDPPILGQPFNLAISITSPGVDDSGVARTMPASNVPVVLGGDGGRTTSTPNAQTTDSSGRAQWKMFCAGLDNQRLYVTLPDGSQQVLNVSACQMPPTSTTTVPPPPSP